MDGQQQDTQPDVYGAEPQQDVAESTETPQTTTEQPAAAESKIQEQQPSVDTPTQPESTEAVSKQEPMEEAGIGSEPEPEIQRLEEQPAAESEGVVKKKSPSREPTKSPSQEPKGKSKQDAKGNVEVKLLLLDGEEKTGYFKVRDSVITLTNDLFVKCLVSGCFDKVLLCLLHLLFLLSYIQK